MSISRIIDHLNRRIYSRAESLVTIDILMEHMLKRLDPSVAGYSEVLDLTGFSTDMSAADIERLAQERKRIAADIVAGPTAVVATDNCFYGMFRMFDILTEDVRPLRVFRDTEEAGTWLDSVCAPQN